MSHFKNAVLRLDQRHDLADNNATIDVDGHSAIAEVVVRMEGQKEDDPQLLAFAERLVACYNLLKPYKTEEFEGVTLADFVAKQAYINQMDTTDGLNLTLSGLAVQMLVASFAGQFKANGATNYLELSGNHPETGPFTITMQRMAGLTPATKLAAMTKQRDELAALLTESCDINKALGFLVDRSDNPGKDDALKILGDHLDKCEQALAGEVADHIVDASNMVVQMTLDEAIEHADSKASETPCGSAHAQLAGWLRDYRAMLTAAPKPEGGEA